MNCKLLMAAAATLTASLSQPAVAASFTKFTDRAAFLGAAGAVGSEDFNSITSDTVIGSGLDLGAFKLVDQRSAVTPGRAVVDAPPVIAGSPNGTSYVRLSAYQSSLYSGFLVFEFDEAITAFGADWVSGNSGLVSLKLLGADLSQYVNGDGFFGFVSDTPFTRLEIHAQAGTGTTISLDNALFSQTAAVPEPASWAMMIAGMGLVGASMRRRSLAVRFA
jgi:hypothetical protein